VTVGPRARRGAFGVSRLDGPRPVDLNTATREGLEALGLGTDPIERILRHREAHGLFRTWEDLAMVARLEPALVDALRQRVKLAGPAQTSEQDVRMTARAVRDQPHVLEPSPPGRLRGNTDKPTPASSLDIGGYSVKP
jgi:hypothetical protein